MQIDTHQLDRLIGTLDLNSSDDSVAIANALTEQGTGERVAAIMGHVVCRNSLQADRLAHRYQRVEWAMGDALLGLAKSNRPRFRQIWRMITDSPSVPARIFAADCVPHVTLVDRRFGFECWNDLLRDPCTEVRHRAYYGLTEAVDAGVSNAHEDLSDEWGLSWRDSAHLLLVYCQAEQAQIGLRDSSNFR